MQKTFRYTCQFTIAAVNSGNNKSVSSNPSNTFMFQKIYAVNLCFILVLNYSLVGSLYHRMYLWNIKLHCILNVSLIVVVSQLVCDLSDLNFVFYLNVVAVPMSKLA